MSTSEIDKPVEIKLVEQVDNESIIDHLKESFFRDEPLNEYVKLCDSDTPTCIELENFCLKGLQEGISTKAVSSGGKIIGVCINNIIRKDVLGEIEECKNPKFSKIMKLFENLDKEADVFGKFPDVDKVLNVKVLSVERAYRGRGIAKKLMDRSRAIGKEQGCGLMRVDCSNLFSARATAALGFKCIYTFKYEDYKEDGKPVFDLGDLHKACTIYVQRL